MQKEFGSWFRLHFAFCILTYRFLRNVAVE